MISTEEQKYCASRAYVPEHLPGYVSSITQAEPFFIDDFLVYLKGNTLILVGYPLSGGADETQLKLVYEKARDQFDPITISLTAPILPAFLRDNPIGEVSDDSYYRLDLNEIHHSKKMRSLLKRAGRDLVISEGGSFRKEHSRLIQEFVRKKSLDQGTRFIFDHIPDYLRTGTGTILEAHNRDGDLVALDIADFSATEVAFYMFNFYSRKHYVPGASDLLMARFVELAREQGKRLINLGLGIHAGVVFFKKKWGAEVYLRQQSCRLEIKARRSFESLLEDYLK